MKKEILLLLAILVGLATFSAHAGSAGTFKYDIIVPVDTTNTGKIRVSLGSTDGASDLLQYDFVYGSTAGLPAGTIYMRKGSNVYLTLGTFNIGSPLFCNVVIENKSGQLSAVKKYSSR